MTNLTYYFPVEVMWSNSDQKGLIWKSKGQNLLGIIINKNMKLTLLTLCRKLESKLCAPGRICKLLNQERRRSLMKALIFWVPCWILLLSMYVLFRSSNNPIYHLHEPAVRTVYNYHSSTFEKKIVSDKSFLSVYQKNIRLLAIEQYKAKNNLYSQIKFSLRDINLYVMQEFESCKNWVIAKI